MRNPFRSEAEAFRFVWLTIGYFALIVIASLDQSWLGVAVFVVLTAVVAWWLFSHGDPKETSRQTPRRARQTSTGSSLRRTRRSAGLSCCRRSASAQATVTHACSWSARR